MCKCIHIIYLLVTDALVLRYTLPKTNMEPENAGFQKEYHLPGGHFQVLC